MPDDESPRDRFVTLYGRIPVLEALLNEAVQVDKVLVARTARGESVDEIVAAAGRRGLAVERVAPEKVTRISRNGRQDQGVVADVVAPRHAPLDRWLGTIGEAQHVGVVVLDGLTTPANVGLVIRTAAAAGIAGVVLPRAGSPDVGPLVVKASAGTALVAPVLRASTASGATESLAGAGFRVVGLRAGAAPSVYDVDLSGRVAVVLGSESDGIGESVARHVTEWAAIPMPGRTESLNVACAGALVVYEFVRRGLVGG